MRDKKATATTTTEIHIFPGTLSLAFGSQPQPLGEVRPSFGWDSAGGRRGHAVHAPHAAQTLCT